LVSEPSLAGVSPQRRKFMATAKLTEQHVQTGLQKLEGSPSDHRSKKSAVGRMASEAAWLKGKDSL